MLETAAVVLFVLWLTNTAVFPWWIIPLVFFFDWIGYVAVFLCGYLIYMLNYFTNWIEARFFK